MSERQLIRTAEAMCDDIDARLSAAKPRPDQPTAEEWAIGFRDFIGFCLGIGTAVIACLAMGG